jgi:branched-chain amino acid transport system permease protein
MVWVNAVVQGLMLGGLYALFACGLSLMFGVMRTVNLAHGDLSVVAAYGSLALVDALGWSPFTTLLIVIPGMAIVGLLLQRLILDRALGVSALAPLLATFGLSIALQNLLLQIDSPNARILPIGSFGIGSWHISSQLSIGWFPLLTLGVAVVVLLAIEVFLQRARLGTAMRATRDDAATAQLMGIDSRKMYALAAMLALATVGIAGVFLGMRTTFTPTSGSDYLIFAFEAVVIGGIGSVRGTLAGGLVLGVAQTVGAQINAADPILIGHLVFLTVLVLRPRGLFRSSALA